MQNSVKISLFTLLMILSTSSIFAQGSHKDRSPEDRAAKMTERMTEALDLNEAQATKIKAIHLKYGERRKAMRSQESEEERGKNKEAKEQMRADIEAEVKAVLTKEQYQKFQEMPRRKPGKRHHRGHGKKSRKYSKEARTLHKEKIEPILLQQRAKLESKISSEDKATLVQLRVDFKKERVEYRVKRKEMKEARKNGVGSNHEERAKYRTERANNPNHIKLVELTEKYSTDIQSLMEEVKPQIQAIRKANCDKNCKKDCGDKKEGKNKGTHHRKHQNKKQAFFLLLDPNAKEDQQPLTPKSAISNVTVYPNPSQGISQIEYDLEKSGMVTLELHDKSGNLIDIIEQTNKTAGSHKASINMGKYTVGVYFIVLKDANGQVISKKIIR